MKDILIVKGSADSPEIKFDENSLTIEISGKSILENTYKFYAPLLHWLRKYLAANKTPLKIIVSFDYLNSSTSRYFMEFLVILSESKLNHEIVWYYEIGDDIIEEKGEQFQSIVSLNFQTKVLEINSI